MATKVMERKIVNRHFLLIVPDNTRAIGVRVEEVIIEYRDQAGLGQANEIAAKRSLKSDGKTTVDFLDDIKVLLVKDVVVGTDSIEVEVDIPDPIKVEIVNP